MEFTSNEAANEKAQGTKYQVPLHRAVLGEEYGMSKFAYYITIDGSILGTNDKSLAQMYADCEDFFVVDSENGVWMLPNSETQDIGQVRYEETSDDDDSD